MKSLEQKTFEHLNKHTGHLEQPLSDIYFEQLYGRYARYDSDFKIVDHKYNLLEKVQIGEDRYKLKYEFVFLTSDMEKRLKDLKKEEKESPESGAKPASKKKKQHKPDNSGKIPDGYSSCDISLTVEEYTGINGDPMWMYIDNVDNNETRIVLPMIAKSIPQYLGVVKKKIKDYQLSENAQKEIIDYFTFKYQTCLAPKCVSEGKRTHYSMLLYGDINDSVNTFADIMIDCFGYESEKTLRITEKNLMSIYSKGELENYFKNRDLIYISECEDRPYVDEDTGTGSSRQKSAEQAELYVKAWGGLTKFVKKHPGVSIIIGMDKYVYQGTFAIDNEITGDTFEHAVYIPKLDVNHVIEMCMREFKTSSFDLQPGFERALTEYIKSTYDDSDLREGEYADKLINDIYSSYFSKPIKNKCLDRRYIPACSDDNETIDEIFARLNGMVGLKSVKEALQRIYKNAVANPDNATKEAYHMMFYGNPGTGKTTVAKLVANLLHKAGIIKTNKCTEATVSDLVSLYKSGTAQKTRTLIKKAMNGVLFIDEAYGLADSDNEHNAEALNVLIQEMLKKQDDLVVILAGYETEMEELLKSNTGLSSRIAYKIRFEDFTVDELKVIFRQRCEDIGFSVDPAADKVLEECIEGRKLQEFFGNARDMKNLVNSLQSNWSEEYFGQITEKRKGNDKPERVFYERHFEGLMPEKNAVGIDSLVGLETVKKEINRFETQVKYLHTIKEYGMKKLPESFMHMVFMGNPGTGKTTVAKMLANDLYSMGVLKTNRLVVIERKDLVSSYRGETSKKTDEFIHKAIGGILFIDEAYSLVDAGEDGKEVIEALITAMVDHKEDTIFIFAGYYNEMRKFLDINPGIPSRVGYTFIFDDYKTDELLKIFHDQMDEAGFKVSDEVDDKVKEIMDYFREMPQFGNGRFVEQLISRIITKRAEREYKKTDYNRIEACDIPEISELIDSNSSGLRLHDPKQITDESRLRTAYHELGHAIAIYELKPAMDMEKISICDGARSLGRVSFKRLGRNRTEEELKNEIIINLAGRCAERVFFGSCDEGCVSDYESAVEIAKDMIDRYGMCDIGLTKPEDLLREGDREAMKVIRKYQSCLEKIAAELIKGKEFTGQEFEEYVKTASRSFSHKNGEDDQDKENNG